MPKLKQNAATIRAELERLQSQLKDAQRSEEEVAGKMARKSGLLDLGLSEKDLLEAMKATAAGFRKADGDGGAERAPKPN